MAKGKDKETEGNGGIRKALIERPAFVALVYANTTFDLKTGKASGFENVVQALMKAISRDRDFCHQYLRGRLKVCMKQGILMPVYTDVTVNKKEGERAKALKEVQALALQAMQRAGVKPELVSNQVDVALGIAGRRAEDQVDEG